MRRIDLSNSVMLLKIELFKSMIELDNNKALHALHIFLLRLCESKLNTLFCNMIRWGHIKTNDAITTWWNRFKWPNILLYKTIILFLIRIKNKMIVLTVLLLSAINIFAIHRGIIDTTTPFGNCTEEKPVYGKPVDGGELGCYDKYALVTHLESYETIEFTDVFYLEWVPIIHITKSLVFIQEDWKSVDFTIFHHNIIINPTPGHLWYIRDRYDRHLFFRTFGEALIPTSRATTTRATTTSVSSTRSFSSQSTSWFSLATSTSLTTSSKSSTLETSTSTESDTSTSSVYETSTFSVSSSSRYLTTTKITTATPRISNKDAKWFSNKIFADFLFTE